MTDGKYWRLLVYLTEMVKTALILFTIYELTSTNIKKSKIEIPHRMKNGAIIVKFKDRPARDLLY